MHLYHFTARKYLEPIKEHGISRGNVATSPSEAIQGAWLTSDASWTTQEWTRASAHDKTEVRITVDIPDDTGKLWHWRDLAKELKVTPEWFDILVRVRGNPDPWHVFLGVVRPEWFVEIEERPPGMERGAGME